MQNPQAAISNTVLFLLINQTHVSKLKSKPILRDVDKTEFTTKNTDPINYNNEGSIFY
ncbi:unnamed protein product [Nesidiocoris tenuis]|uniref:Uncharacterized protein n=1 Tax=Nesidiocoris tenuis TaxID=355587 RepID=A0A6H5H5D3_9HEMI|nr:unnamed protein product [Nesidiocoris tenuis]